MEINFGGDYTSCVSDMLSIIKSLKGEKYDMLVIKILNFSSIDVMF